LLKIKWERGRRGNALGERGNEIPLNSGFEETLDEIES